MSGKRWVVLEPPSATGPDAEAVPAPTAEAQFVKDAFSTLAFFFLFLWLFWHRLWLAGITVLALYIAIAMIGWWQDFGVFAWFAQTGLALLVGLEARNILIAKRLRTCWRMAAVLYADGRAEAELRYYDRDRAPASERSDDETRRPVGQTPVAGDRHAAALPWAHPVS
ncbi:DUF2628 domain-containing protein [Fulvimarina sp. 2208YS6-2-32]|uniref:DUF2628 domain-containing protein n=1 Tax=Fulvimarina uroteuthidis TaxID=3098149 RepID=A0ABU5I650_9HYPH|nr:DUF2628 domain-containing protein [Fulvimarina sp. 2208YS6-2-32]MDY8110852.1 DUF2628 domain-containing protein [Fulvimarina sp. 2208YS6-2-32]